MIGEVIHQKRKELHLTQVQLADMLQVTAPAVNKWEKNQCYPDVTLLAPLARCLRIDLNDLFSFYQCLSDKERDLIVKKINSLLMNFKDEEAFEYIDKVVRQNSSDGLLYKKIADTLHGFHLIKRINNPTIYLDKIIYFYEKALELIPEESIDIAYSLITVHSEIGNKDRAIELMDLIPENTLDKKWVNIEMLYLLKDYKEALLSTQKYILKSIIELITNIGFLKEILKLSNKIDLAETAEIKENELISLFGISPIIKAFNNMSDAYSSNDLEAQINAISHLFDVDKKQLISSCSLFSEVVLENEEKCNSKADAIINFNNWSITD